MARPAGSDDGGPVRVLYLIDSLTAGGAERSLAALAPGLVASGIALDVAYLHERDGVGPELEAAGARLVSLAGPGGIAGAAWRAARLIRSERPDIVHTTLFEADLAGRIGALGSRVPVITSLVNAAYGPEQLANPALKPWRVRAAQVLDTATARRVTRFHAVSASVGAAMAPRLHIKPDRIEVVARGRDPERLGRRTDARRAAARARIGAADADRIVLAVGRQEYQKGFDLLLKAFAAVRADCPQARLLIAGRDGAATPDLRALITHLDLSAAVELLGPRDDIADLMCAADVFAFPSRWEGMPGAVLEAMALEVPIVAAGTAMVREVIGDSGGAWLVPSNDAAALAAGILAALHDPDPDAGQRTSAARARFLDRYTLERAVAGMVSLYERVASG